MEVSIDTKNPDLAAVNQPSFKEGLAHIKDMQLELFEGIDKMDKKTF